MDFSRELDHSALKKYPLVLNAKGRIMGKGDMKINLSMPISNKPSQFKFTGTIGKLNLVSMYGILSNTHIRIEKGKLKRMLFTMTGKNQRIDGEMAI